MNKFTKLAADLRAAKALIATPATWTKNQYAKDSDGRHVHVDSEFAVCYCSIGAVIKATKAESRNDVWQALDDAVEECESIVELNDSHTHAEVMGVWNKAIATAEANAVVLNLEMAKDKIAIEDNWIKGNYATDINGDAVDTTSVSATCFCAFGAIEVVSAKPHQELYTRTFSKEPEYEFLDKAAISLWHTYDYEEYGNNAAGYNDAPTTTHANILALFDAAIVLAKAAV